MSEWRKANPKAYNAACRFGLLDKIRSQFGENKKITKKESVVINQIQLKEEIKSDTWKIKNISKLNVPIALSNYDNSCIGLILKQGEFVLCHSRITTSLDSQMRRGLIEIDKSFNNIEKLTIGQIYES